ncbi:MAG: Yip1 protein [Firmicutes bacterium]|nr:Yip1 protein [Bacillota bacterium]
MENFFDNLYDVLFSPAQALRRIGDEKRIGQALTVFLLSVLIPAVVLYFVFQSMELFKLGGFVLVIETIGRLLVWFVSAAVLHLIAEFFGGTGTAKGFFVATGFAYLPQTLAVPFWVVAMFLPSQIMTALVGVTSLVVFFWTLTLNVLAIKEVHRISGAKAVLVLVTPAVVGGILLVGLLIIAFAAFMPERMLW